MSNENILTRKNMPWLDLGELPVSYNSHKSEAFQVYLVPQDELPFNMVVNYENWIGRYSNKKLKTVYPKTQLPTHGITVEDVEDTLRRASELVAPYRGQLAHRGKIVKLSLGAGGIIFLIIAVVVGM